MVTLYRGAYKTAPRASVLSGLKDSPKPTTKPDGSLLENGAEYLEIDTGKVFRFDAENQKWYEGRSQE